MITTPASSAGKLEKQLLPKDLWTVFLVDDDPDDLALGKRVLNYSPYIEHIVCVPNAEQLFYELRSRHFFYDAPGNPPNSLIILDIHMPETDGIELLTQLRTSPYTENVPVIMLTGDLCTNNIEKTYHLEANGYIVKPLSMHNLDHVHRVLERGRSWQQAV